MRRRATKASFEPLQGDSVPLPALASTPLQRFGPVALAPARDEQGHYGWELRAPPDTSLQAGIGLKTKGPALDRIAMTFGFALASMRTNMTLPIVGRRKHPPQARSRECKSRRLKALARAWKTALSWSPNLCAPAVSHPHTNGTIVTRVAHDRRRSKGVENGGLRYGAMGGRASPAVSHTRQPPLPKQLLRLSLANASAHSPKQGDTRCSKTNLTNRSPYESGELSFWALRGFWWKDLACFHSASKLIVRIFRRRYSSSRKP